MERMMRRKRRLSPVPFLVVACCAATLPFLWTPNGAASPQAVPAQSRAYDVASIKPDKSADNGARTQSMPDGFRWTNFPIVFLIRAAYGVRMDNQIEGLPDWARTERYDFEAKVDAQTAEAWKPLSYKERRKQEQPMMQSLLADRCELKVHLQTRELPVYDLVIAKGGLKMTEAAQDEVNSEGMSMNKLTAHALSTDSIAVAFEGSVGRMIVDKTGLAGKRFDFELTWSPDDRRGADATADDAPSIFTALQEQLGLKLVPDKGPVEVVVIDHISRPTPN